MPAKALCFPCLRNHNFFARKFLSLISLSLVAVAPLSYSSSAQAQRASASLIGGEYASDFAGRDIAYIENSESSCTGTLVGRREILTAAHCVAEGPGPSDYGVYVGGAWRSVESIWYNRQFDPSQPFDRAAQYDLGMLILSEPVVSVVPTPVLRGARIQVGTKFIFAGYGFHEIAPDPNGSFFDDFKIGVSRVTRANGRTINGSHRPFRASACSGDSGGPAEVAYTRTNFAVVGVISGGINVNDGSVCYLSGNGRFTLVDLQSPSSRAFLSAFPGVYYARMRSR